jgi:hypothetical protein
MPPIRPKPAWVSQNPREAELIAQRGAGYGDEIRDQFITRKWQYRMLPVTDAELVAGLQKGDRLAGGAQSAPGKHHCSRSSRASLRAHFPSGIARTHAREGSHLDGQCAYANLP